jgi:protein-disulfide isomerase
MKKNIWLVGFIIILVAALGAIWFARKASNIDSGGQEEAQIAITAEDHVKGSQNASVTLVEWSDFQCPACRSYYPILKALSAQFPDDLRIVYRHFPLRAIHLGAEPAARASEAASLQGKFWEMHDLIFENQDSWGPAPTREAFEKLAQVLGLDIERYRSDVESDAVKNHVSNDLRLGNSLGINSTPTFYLNGRKISNPLSLDAFSAVIQAELNKDE